MEAVYILGAARTPMGAMQGVLSSASASSLGGAAIAAAVAESLVPVAHIDELLMGCVLPAGQGQAPARQGRIFLPDLVKMFLRLLSTKCVGQG